MSHSPWLLLALLGLSWLAPAPSFAEDDSSAEEAVDAAEADGDAPRRSLIAFNEYEGPWITVRVGGGLLFDALTYSQTEDSERQMNLNPKVTLRDFRFTANGRFPKFPRLSYSIGYMWDGSDRSWRVRQTGLMVQVPELWGRFFIGRSKEGISMNKIMVGYQGFTMERATANDSFVPILADGVKYMGNSPSGEFLWNIGWFGDLLSDKESFNRFDTQVAARGVWLPLPAENPNDSLLHIGLGLRWAKADDGEFHFRSKPEASSADSNAVDSGEFPADHSNMAAPEIYYQRGPWLFGFEYFLHQVTSHETNHPFFHGGEALMAWIVTGETRPYNRKGGHFDRVSPARTVFSGGPGAWELVFRVSYTDMDDELIEGGRFWRLTPMVNWHMSDNVRLEFTYGWGMLDRFDLRGQTQFFGTRIQFQL